MPEFMIGCAIGYIVGICDEICNDRNKTAETVRQCYVACYRTYDRYKIAAENNCREEYLRYTKTKNEVY